MRYFLVVLVPVLLAAVIAGCNLRSPIETPTPGVGARFNCGFQINGDGIAHYTFDIKDDKAEPETGTVPLPFNRRNDFRCTAGSVMEIRADIQDINTKHKLQCKLYRKGQQVKEDHAGTIVPPKTTLPRVLKPTVHCRYPR